MRKTLISAAILYAVLISAVAFEARAYMPGSHFAQIVPALVCLLAPLWFFGFDAECFQYWPKRARILFAGVLALPYVFAWFAFSWTTVALALVLPAGSAALLVTNESRPSMTWRDVVVLTSVVALFYSKVLQPQLDPTLSFFPKIFVADVVLYCFLAARKLEGIGYSLIPSRSALLIGTQEWLFYLPFALTIGLGTGFIHLHLLSIAPGKVIAAILITFFFIAIPEELFFRGILQNLLESRLGRTGALIIAAFLFGLSHFNHGSRFNWRYVLLASIAGIFYGRAWRANRQIFASAVTHTLIDTIWSMWLR